jgi:hypothetical protein
LNVWQNCVPVLQSLSTVQLRRGRASMHTMGSGVGPPVVVVDVAESPPAPASGSGTGSTRWPRQDAYVATDAAMRAKVKRVTSCAFPWGIGPVVGTTWHTAAAASRPVRCYPTAKTKGPAVYGALNVSAGSLVGSSSSSTLPLRTASVMMSAAK